MTITIGLQVSPQHGAMERMRAAWMEADKMGVTRLYTADHFFAQVLDREVMEKGQAHRSNDDPNFEATTIQAAMAATTTQAEIGCIVHAIGYRNPNLLADIARTIDHICGGRFILGLGSGYLKRDYDEYGYEYGTQKSRLMDLARSLPLIKRRFEQLNPPPLRKIPLLMASIGEKIGLRLVAEHADIWHAHETTDVMLHKQEVLKKHCREIGREYEEIERITHHIPQVKAESDPDEIVDVLGIRHIVCLTEGPHWDLGPLRELLAWSKARNAREASRHG